MTVRAAIYARYSSDLQSDASIEDQVRLCNEKAESEGWKIGNCYTDAGISGASLLRSGIQGLLTAAMNGEFEILLCEALDRLSRDQEDIAGLYKRMEFAGVKIITLSEGEISTLHIGLKGTMNAMFLKDLADKTRRGLRGRVEKGKSGGGLAYGYKVVKQFDANGEAIRGDREISEEQAEIVKRIFREYSHENKSPKAIAAQLNKEAIPCPSGSTWGASTINGNRRRGTGILNNELYRGKLIWNRNRMVKDPSTGRRVSRQNDESVWIRKEMPELRILPKELWNAAKARQAVLDKAKPALWRTNRPQYLLSGLTKCGVCGGGYSKINSSHYGCSASKNKGEAVCANRKTIKREILEGYVLDALKTRLMQTDLVEVFCKEYTNHLNMLNNQKSATKKRHRSELTTLEKERVNLIQAIKDGVPAAMIKDDLERVTTRKEEVSALLAAEPANKPLLHPAMASRFHQSVKDLASVLNQDGARSEASEHLRGLVDKIVLTPKADEDGLTIDLYGDLSGILNMSIGDKNMNLIERLALSPVNDNSPQAFQQDSNGSGGTLLTLSSLLINAFDIASKPPISTTASALLSKSPITEGVHASMGADYTYIQPSLTSEGWKNG
ncbi:MAG: resolvase [SAR86 cluster bacterium]|uniref:Resolvase n=1 Tax=SAR86 cluster bacterium TaxID=2030880 RepID=A0A2A5AMH2_9GAMM|nr:MAG: resolvase [SAR86 cluster bacterium]